MVPQGFTESPNLFEPALERMLQSFEPPEGTKLLQYVDDLVIAGRMQEQAKKGTIELLNFLEKKKGLKVSKSKLQFVEPKVKYLRH